MIDQDSNSTETTIVSLNTLYIILSHILQAVVHSALLLVVAHCLADDGAVPKKEDQSCEILSVENTTISHYMRLLHCSKISSCSKYTLYTNTFCCGIVTNNHMHTMQHA